MDQKGYCRIDPIGKLVYFEVIESTTDPTLCETLRSLKRNCTRNIPQRERATDITVDIARPRYKGGRKAGEGGLVEGRCLGSSSFLSIYRGVTFAWIIPTGAECAGVISGQGDFTHARFLLKFNSLKFGKSGPQSGHCFIGNHDEEHTCATS
jgi:hypothetical protein